MVDVQRMGTQAMVIGLSEVGAVVLFVAWLVALVEVVLNPTLPKKSKIIWVLCLIFLNVLATLVYWVLKFIHKR